MTKRNRLALHLLLILSLVMLCHLRMKLNENMSKVPYMNAIGSLMYVMVCTRPDISHVVDVVSMYMYDPGKDYWQVIK